MQWRVDDLVSDYSRILDRNIEALLSKIEQNHWRTNPNFLCDATVTIIKAGVHDKVEILTGTIVETKAKAPYGSLRIAIEKDETTQEINELNHSHSDQAHGSMTPQREVKRIQAPTSAQQTTQRIRMAPKPSSLTKQAMEASSEDDEGASLHYTGFQPLNLNTGFTSVAWTDFETKLTTEQQVTIFDDDAVWVRRPGPGQVWIKPDTLCLEAVKKVVSTSDGASFWEMTRAIVEMVDLREQCKGRMCAISDIAAILGRQEFRVLWSFNERVPGFLPKRSALQLLQECYACKA